MLTVRSHGEGTIFQRKSGRDRGSWVVAVTMRDGRRASRVTRTRDDAKAQLTELLRLRDAGAPQTGRVRLGDYLERWVNDVRPRHDENSPGLAPATWRKHESAIRTRLIPSLGGVRLSELRPADVSAFLREQGDLHPQSLRHLRATLRRALADAIRDGLIVRNPAALAAAPPLHATERTILDATQARILIESTKGTRYGPLWTILVTTGLRISEALGLAWSAVELGGNDGTIGSVDAGIRGHARKLEPGLRGNVKGPSLTVRHQLAREAGEWVFRKPKTAKGRRTVPLTPLGVEALRAQRQMQREDMARYYGGDDGRDAASVESGLGAFDVAGDHPAARRSRRSLGEGRDVGVQAPPSVPGIGGSLREQATPGRSPVTPIDGLVFTSERGAPLHGENTVKLLQRDLAAAGLPRVTQHDLRHSCATLLYSMGVPLETIADILGHSSSRITADLYRHRSADLQVEAASRMQEALG